jgi:hypothetical protein
LISRHTDKPIEKIENLNSNINNGELNLKNDMMNIDISTDDNHNIFHNSITKLLSSIEIDNYSRIDINRNESENTDLENMDLKKFVSFDSGIFHMLDIDSLKVNKIPHLIGEIKDSVQLDIDSSIPTNSENSVPKLVDNDRVSIEKNIENRHDLIPNNSVRKNLLKVFSINLWS